MTNKFLVLVALVAIAAATPLRNMPEPHVRTTDSLSSHPDEITSLPGAPSLPFRQYSGYLSLPGTKKQIFYWLVNSQSNPKTDPVVFWSNGGPGCSGLIGFLTEHGPFRPRENLTLAMNPHSWNKIANMVYLEAPAGVGFSYSEDKNDYTIGDDQTIKDFHAALNAFMGKYPTLAQNDVYFTSESYGGHYAPLLAQSIVNNNTAHLNFKGFMVGNPLTNMVENGIGQFDTMYGHSVVSRPVYQQWQDDCRGQDNPSDKCDEIEGELITQISDLNPYALDYPICHDQVRSSGRAQRNWLMNHLYHNRPHAAHALKLIPPVDYEPCEADYSASYLNQPAVKDAIHAKSSITWTMCSTTVDYNQEDVSKAVQDVYQVLHESAPELRMFIVSGDDDTVCGTMGTQYWLWDMNFKVEQDWQAWMYNNTKYGSQVGGFIVEFDALAFATVHGAGHEIPAYRPEAAFELFQTYLSAN